MAERRIMSNFTKTHTFEVGKHHYKIISGKGRYHFVLLEGDSTVVHIYGMKSTALDSPQIRFAPKWNSLLEYTPENCIAIQDATTFLEKKYNQN